MLFTVIALILVNGGIKECGEDATSLHDSIGTRGRNGLNR